MMGGRHGDKDTAALLNRIVDLPDAKTKGENQCTVVTETRSLLKGKRVIHGRESECTEFYLG